MCVSVETEVSSPELCNLLLIPAKGWPFKMKHECHTYKNNSHDHFLYGLCRIGGCLNVGTERVKVQQPRCPDPEFQR